MSKDYSGNRRTFLKSGLAALLGARYWHSTAEAMRPDDHPSVHGMLVVGQETVFLSHLPIFGSPHDYQVIIEGTFAKPGSTPQADYFNDRKRTGAKLYTVEPRPFVLTDLTAASPLRSFKVNIYRGHFERFRTERAKEAARIGQDVDVNVTRVVRFQKFDPKAAALPRLEYFLFGKGKRNVRGARHHETSRLRPDSLGDGADAEVQRCGLGSRCADRNFRKNQYGNPAHSPAGRDGAIEERRIDGGHVQTPAERRVLSRTGRTTGVTGTQSPHCKGWTTYSADTGEF